jgi:glyceraldehyde-3-phosphate dehydrogenase (NADP+)
MNYRFLIGNEWRDSNNRFEVINPYNSETVGTVCMGDKKDFEEAVIKGLKGFDVIKRLSSFERAEILNRVWNGINKRKEEIAKMITLESGKPIKDSRIEVERSINTFKIAEEEAKRLYGEFIPLDITTMSKGRIGITKRFPIGLILGITPFNFPINLVAHKIAPAIASGNSIIIKPSPLTPITSIMLGEIISDSGIPDGVLSIIPTENSVVEEIIPDNRIKKITFTGSFRVGWNIKKKAYNKRVTLELGGNAAVIIDSDKNIEYAVERCIRGSFSYAGQVCISVQRIFIKDNIYDRFMELFIDGIKRLKIGDPSNEDTDIGPMISLKEAERVEEWIGEAVKEGAKIIIGGSRSGSIFYPTLLTDVSPTMKVYSQEIFAPVVCLISYNKFEDAIREVNNSVYGLQAGIFTRDIYKILKAYEEIDVGGIIINDVPTFRVDNMPYGGVKKSGFGREGIRYAIEEMTGIKVMVINQL